ncbi:TonB-dependent receptor [Chryseobacterium vrystaatense]|uniref:Iron complex outermembrane recepter protein n=1 Tax=Chryseobacterium vrystaatense TaxID=307480 RepID=A0A1M5NIE3_9FLAO|nr:TonB-dependent receptor [Chryseobacterium vrystaatense]SHG89291.1 iron complex outermembrane recepter protein [Chryseobacterium vrystaatense]
MNTTRKALCINGIMLLLPFALSAQETHSIFGTILNQDGKVISNATVTMNTGASPVHTTSEGHFKFEAPVQYPAQLMISAKGYSGSHMTLDSLSYNDKNGIIIRLAENQTDIQEVLITARRNNSYLTNTLELGGKFSGNLKDLPQSVSIVSSEFMEDKQAYTTREVAQDLAGVTTASSYDDLIIRGFKSGYETGIRLVNGLRSGYSYGNSYYRSPLTINLESVSVLKGPGASLFGDITPGGTINMVTKKPLEKQKGSVNFSVGSFQTLRTSIDLGGPLDKEKKILYRLNAGYEDSKTFRNVNQQKNFMIAPSFTFKPLDGTQVDIDLVYDQFHGYLDRGMGLRNNDFYALPRSFTLSQPSDFYNTKTWSFSARLNQRLTHNLSLNASYMKSVYQEDVNEHRTLNSYADAPLNTIMNMRFFDRHGKDYTDNSVVYLKWDLPGKTLQHHLIAGVDYAQYQGDSNNQQREARQQKIDGKNVALTFDLNNPTYTTHDLSNYVWLPQGNYPFLSPYKTTGIYIQDQISFAERLKLIAGLRHEHYYSETVSSANRYQATQNAWLPRIGVTYQISNQINYFASYSQGFAPVGANFIENYKDYGAEKPFTAEHSFQIETGLKTGFFKNQLQMDLSLFQIERRNMLIATGEISTTGFPVYRQSGKALSKGVELDIRGQLTKEFQIMGNYTYNQTEVKSSSIASETGQSLPGAPENMASMWLKYVFSKTALKGLGLGAGVYYVDSRRMDNSIGKDSGGNALWGYWPSYTTVNAAVYYHIGKMKMAVNVNNVFDTYYFLGGFDYTRGFPGAPRNVMVSAGYSF